MIIGRRAAHRDAARGIPVAARALYFQIVPSIRYRPFLAPISIDFPPLRACCVRFVDAGFRMIKSDQNFEGWKNTRGISFRLVFSPFSFHITVCVSEKPPRERGQKIFCETNFLRTKLRSAAYLANFSQRNGNVFISRNQWRVQTAVQSVNESEQDEIPEGSTGNAEIAAAERSRLNPRRGDASLRPIQRIKAINAWRPCFRTFSASENVVRT